MKKVILIGILLLPFICLSENPPPPGLEDPTPAASIDQIEIILFFTAIYLGVFFVYRKSKKKEEDSCLERKAKFNLHHSHKTDKL